MFYQISDLKNFPQQRLTNDQVKALYVWRQSSVILYSFVVFYFHVES